MLGKFTVVDAEGAEAAHWIGEVDMLDDVVAYVEDVLIDLEGRQMPRCVVLKHDGIVVARNDLGNRSAESLTYRKVAL